MSQLQRLKVPDFEQQKNERIGEISKEPRTEMLLASEDLYEILSAKITNVRGTPNLNNNNNVSIIIQNNT